MSGGLEHYPEPIRTKRRCQFSLPGRKYNCRAMGKYVLGAKGYCAHHYDIAWRVANPKHGQQHEWVESAKLTTWFFRCIEHCGRCGVIRQHEGLPQSPCNGKLPRIVLMENAA